MTVEDSRLLELLQKMMLTRSMESRHRHLLAQYKNSRGPFICFAHLSRGQEAVGIGATAALREDDVMIGTHRGFVEYVGKGMRPLDIFAEYLGKKHILNGKSGIQISDKAHNIPSMTACIGGGFGIAVGMAYAIKMRGEDRVVMLCYGDGAYNQADAHPAMVIASSLKLPLLFHCPYNGWTEYTRSEEVNPTGSVAARGCAYNIPFDSVDGQRVEVVYEAAMKAVEHVRSGRGPFIQEYRTNRLGPHWSGDNGSYMDKEENQELAKRDPVRLCKELLIERGALTEEGFARMNASVMEEVEETIDQALQLHYPSREDMFSNVTAGGGGSDV
jgi:TPP-dependent pyruvate/acetoin dehydrogenase alpha subunit